MLDLKLKDFVEVWNYYARERIGEDEARHMISSMIGNEDSLELVMGLNDVKVTINHAIKFTFELVFEDGKRFVEFTGYRS